MNRLASETRTKIVCTIGPASRSDGVIRAMIRSGMDVARINFSHGTKDEHREEIGTIRRIAVEEEATVAILADLQGPKLRIGELTRPLDLKRGDFICLTDLPADGSDNVIPLPHPGLIGSARVGGHLLFDDGLIEAVVREARPDALIAEVVLGGRLSSHKGIAAPGSGGSIETLTDKDRDDARYAVARGVDFIALSFVRRAEDIESLRRFLAGIKGGESAGIIAKVEKREAIENIDGIIRAADAVMVARGDLGLELSPQEVPFHQKEIIRRCNRLGVPVITATQMLQSMISSPRPTRAEASDVANAILDGTDALMLSAETASGEYPVEAVEMMREISAIAERKMPPRIDELRFEELEHTHPVTDAISDATARIADEVDAKLIVTSTWSGYTARQIARERPHQPIVALTPNENVARQLALVWGVTSLRVEPYEGADGILGIVSEALIDAGYAKAGDLVVITGGLPIGGGGKTNFIKVHRL